MSPKGNLVTCITIAIVVVAMSANIGANPLDFIDGAPNLMIIAKEMTNIDPKLLDTAFWAMLETLQMAFVGTIAGVVMGLPLSLLSSRNISSRWVYIPIRSLLAAIRTFPSILWAILFVIVVGTGTFAGVLAITLYTIGFVTKLQYETIESIDADPMEAVSSIGVSKWQLVRYVVIPESATHILGHALYMFDYNVRQTSILGLVGAGGIGFYIITYIKYFDYGSAMIFMAVVLVTVLSIDWISVRVRDAYVVKPQKGTSAK
ncbi:MAG: phosphonate ABC transporter inner membrane subunit (phnE) [Cenarchaeum symbiont of Oopsacas minuta]|nr:phosphonate ABC transporter inner membrane subunit (phnE) [Cenarchaeum symbiont of Oopsacas minuta]